MKRLKGNLMLLVAAFIWGTTFVAQSVGMDQIGPFAFNGIRMFIGTLALVPVILVIDAINRKRKKPSKGFDRHLFAASLCCGGCLFAASTMQQIGLVYTTPGKSGFITAMYVVLVPLLGIFWKKKTGVLTWISVVLAAAGLWFLCINEEFTLQIGDFYTMICALLYAFHILCVDHFSPRVDGVKLSCLQFLVAGVLSVPFLVFAEGLPTLSALQGALIPILYAGFLSCGVAYTFQIIGQKDTDPTVASILMCLESVFAVLAGIVVLGQIPTPAESVGCALMFAAIVIAQLPPIKKRV